MSLPVLLMVILLGLYGLLILLLIDGVRRLKKSPSPKGRVSLGVDLIIPYKDEQDHLPLLVADLLAQDYPRELFRVLFINDHSSDGSADTLASLTRGRSNFLSLDQAPGRQGKKAALSLGMAQVEADWVLQVDADCRLMPGFLSARMAFVEHHPADLVAGPVRIRVSSRGLLARFEALDLLSLMASGAGSYPHGRALMCNGANLLYRRELHEQTRRFDSEGIPSGDDMFLMIGARKLGFHLEYHASPETTVCTPSTNSWKALLRQRIRWGGKSTAYGMGDIQAVALLVVLANLAILLVPLCWILEPEVRVLLGALLAGKWLLDYVLLRMMARKTGQKQALRSYLLVAVLHPPYLVLSALASLIFAKPRRNKW